MASDHEIPAASEPSSSVVGPNSVPTGSRYETSTENYAAPFPYVPEPSFITELAERMRRARTGAPPSLGRSQRLGVDTEALLKGEINLSIDESFTQGRSEPVP